MLAEHFHGTIVAGAEQSWLFDEAKKRGIRTIVAHHLKRSINPYHDLLAFFELRRIIRTEKPDIIHLNSTKAGILGTLASPCNREHVTGNKTAVSAPSLSPDYKLSTINYKLPRIVYTVHGFVLNEAINGAKKAFYGLLERLAGKRRDWTIAVSKEDSQAILQGRCADPRKLSVIENGIEPIDFLGRRSARQQLNLADNVVVVGTIANLYKTKGLDILIESISSVIARHPNKHISLAIIGDGPERESLKRLVERHQIEKHVLFFGQMQNASRLLKALDLFVLPSRKEGMPFALLEAMQAGLPIVATKVGGVAEVLAEAGILVEPEQAVALAQAIEEVIKDELIQKKLGALAQKRVEAFSSNAMIAHTDIVYKEIFLKP